MHKGLATSLATAAAGVFLALPAGPAVAGGFEGSTNGQGTYSVQVSVTGSGVGSGGSLAGPPVSGGGGTVSVPSPCGFDRQITQQQIEARFGGDKAKAEKQYPNFMIALFGYDKVDKWPAQAGWERKILASWGKQGTWYLPACDGTVGFDKFVRFALIDNTQVLVGPGGAAGPPVPKLDPKFLEDIAIRAMTLPNPKIGHNPSAEAQQTFVNVPGGTWFWTPGMTKGTTRSVTASAAGVSAKATATFNGTTFTSSGGASPNSVFCSDGGKPYTRGASASPCTLNYVTSSGAGAYTVTAASRWSAVVTSPLGTRGIPGATMPGTSQVRVAEIQTVVR